MADANESKDSTNSTHAPNEKKTEKKNAKPSSRALKTDLNQLWKSTVEQFDEMKELIVRSSTAGKARFDATLERRHREKAVLELGEKVLQAMAQEGLKLPKSCAEILETIRLHDEEIANHEDEVHLKSTAAEKKTAETKPEIVDAKVED